MTCLIQKRALARIDQIFDYTLKRWGEQQAESYIKDLFAYFDDIERNRMTWRPIPAEFAVQGYFGRYRNHVVFWRERPDGRIAIVTILHERMDLDRRLRDDTGNR